MKYSHTEICVKTPGRGFTDITTAIDNEISSSSVSQGVCTIFIRHTSASLIISENADPTVRGDLEGFMSTLVRDGHPDFQHIWEGKDDMSAHIRSVITATSLTVPIRDSRLYIGRWQAIYLWEHRYHSHNRLVSVSLIGTDR
ncbi:MAG: secondary thiamine-phosphate synthase enzyme YjbQ [Myxococcota bacterium]|nr:secondary thiamine-phosphate synthase enzyme YjbQ [Myxococcota bacterium]